MRNEVLIKEDNLEEICNDIIPSMSDYVLGDYSIHVDRINDSKPNILLVLDDEEYRRLDEELLDDFSYLEHLKLTVSITNLDFDFEVNPYSEVERFLNDYELLYYTDESILDRLAELGCSA